MEVEGCNVSSAFGVVAEGAEGAVEAVGGLSRRTCWCSVPSWCFSFWVVVHLERGEAEEGKDSLFIFSWTETCHSHTTFISNGYIEYTFS